MDLLSEEDGKGQKPHGGAYFRQIEQVHDEATTLSSLKIAPSLDKGTQIGKRQSSNSHRILYIAGGQSTFPQIVRPLLVVGGNCFPAALSKVLKHAPGALIASRLVLQSGALLLYNSFIATIDGNEPICHILNISTLESQCRLTIRSQ